MISHGGFLHHGWIHHHVSLHSHTGGFTSSGTGSLESLLKFLNLLGIFLDGSESGLSEVLELANTIFVFLDLGELSAENDSLITTWLQNLTVELEDNLFLTIALSSVCDSSFFSSPSGNDTWEDEARSILSSEGLVQFLLIFSSEPGSTE